MRKRLSILLLSSVMVFSGLAQDFKYEVGAAAGLGFYMGDLNSKGLYYKSSAAYGLVFRNVLNYRWAIKYNLITSRMKGNTTAYNTILPQGEQYSFSRQLIDLGAQAEFNFFHYGLGYSYLGTKRFAPYIVAGLGFSYSPVPGDHFFTLNIPLGVGVKYKIAPRWNVGFEFTMRKSFGDGLDGRKMIDPYLIKSGFMKNTDWYSFTFFSITYDIGAKKKICNNL